jgi:ribosome recycling factor
MPAEAEEVDLVLEDGDQSMQKSIEGLKRELDRVRTGRANPSILDNVQVKYYGSNTPLKSLATVSAPEARLIVVQPFDLNAISEIERGILKADLGLTPMSDGKVVRVTIPELTEERRKTLVKNVKRLAEDHKVGVRSARRDAMAQLKALKDDGDISEDDFRRGQTRVQEQTDQRIAEVDSLISAKEREILTI